MRTKSAVQSQISCYPPLHIDSSTVQKPVLCTSSNASEQIPEHPNSRHHKHQPARDTLRRAPHTSLAVTPPHKSITTWSHHVPHLVECLSLQIAHGSTSPAPRSHVRAWPCISNTCRRSRPCESAIGLRIAAQHADRLRHRAITHHRRLTRLPPIMCTCGSPRRAPRRSGAYGQRDRHRGHTSALYQPMHAA